jgi:prepilin-type processing-associated H-X9-DG protein
MKTLEKQTSREIKDSGGFTTIELLAIIATVAMLAALLLPAVARAAGQSQGAKCLNNIRQLILAAQMYATDNVGLWFPNQPGEPDWVQDPMSWTTNNPANTNWQYLITSPAPGSNPNAYSPYNSFFTPYIKDPSIYRCPADPSVVGGVARIRSYSANQAIGTCWTGVTTGCLYGQADQHVTGQWLPGAGGDNDCQDYGFTYQKLSQMVRPKPTTLFVFAEEHPDSINDSTLAVQIGQTDLGGGAWIDVPSNLHNGAGSFSFADGHAEIHKWVGRLMSTLTYVQNGYVPEINYEGANQPTADTAADLKDLNWVQARTSAPINPSIPFPSP